MDDQNLFLKLTVVFMFLSLSTGIASAASSGRVVPEIDHPYSSLIIGMDSSREIFFQVKNPSSQTKQVESTVSGIDANFSSTDSSSTGSYSLEPGEERRFVIFVKPSSTGTYQLYVNTQNLDTGLNTTVSMPVKAREYAVSANTREVPGIGIIQLFTLLLVSAYLYSVRL